MAGYTAISDISNTLAKILKDNLIPNIINKPDSIGICSPSDKGDYLLGIYLYNISESDDLRISSRQQIGTTQIYPPTILSLYYMITSYSSSDIKFRASEDHMVLGGVIQTLNDNNVFNFGDSVKNEQATIQLIKMSADEQQKIWKSSSEPYRVSLFYKISPVEIQSNKKITVPRVVDVDFTMENMDERH